jgi:hypothetical protein
MTALRRTAEIKGPGAPRLRLELSGLCQFCNRHRSHGNHRACSKKRQALYAQRAKESI